MELIHAISVQILSFIRDVWDGLELEGVPEEEADTPPFKVIEEGVINHFSHKEHNLFLVEDVIIDGGEDMYCEACCRPISFERYYNCMKCDFMLHEYCASLSLRKRHGISTSKLSLSTGKEKKKKKKNNNNLLFYCDACGNAGNGFRYQDGKGIKLDVHCASLSCFRHRKIHPHPFFLTVIRQDHCAACSRYESMVLTCVGCEVVLGFTCATLPVVIKHKCDDHYLFLSSGEKKPTGKYWCEICEAETSPRLWFYTCYDCGVACHIDCVIGESLNIKPGFLCLEDGTKIEAVLNNNNSRPLCSKCASRCTFPMVYKFRNKKMEGLYCSLYCIGEHAKAV